MGTQIKSRRFSVSSGQVFVAIVGLYMTSASLLKFAEPYKFGSLLESQIGTWYIYVLNVVLVFELLIGLFCLLYSSHYLARHVGIFYNLALASFFVVIYMSGYSAATGYLGGFISGGVGVDVVRTLCVIVVLYISKKDI